MAESTGRRKPAPTKTARKRNGTRADSAALLDQLRTFVRTRSAQLLQDPNVTSVGIGYKQVDGAATRQLALQFTVDRKVAPESIEALGSTRIPPAIDIGGVLVPTDVIERTYAPAYVQVELTPKDPRKVRAAVLQPGLSIGNLHTTAGTLGALVRDCTTGRTVMLSNWHVLHGPDADIGVDVVQPGRHDDNRVQANKVGRLLRSHLGAAGDCAIASIANREMANEVLGLGLPIVSVGDPELGDKVIKSGRTTGVTQGVVVRIEVNTRLDYGTGSPAVIGGFEIGVDDSAAPADGEISRGGDSGAAWLAMGARNKPTGVMLGLHFAGDADGTNAEFALACYASSVMTALEVEPLPAGSRLQRLGDGLAARHGFDNGFLDFPIDPPAFSRSHARDLATLEGEAELRYCHFSVWLSRSRKYPLCVAWNIDGSQFKRLKRTSFRTDRRGDLAAYQLTDALYRHNPLDKGHIARRADLCWGPPDEARQANHDSFYYTNIVPQHQAFNQSGNTDDDPEGGVWGRLENTVFDAEAPHRLRVSVLGGPVAGRDDPRFTQGGEECLIPAEFWKVVCYRDDRDGREKAYGFLLTQRHLVEPLAIPEGLELDAWLWARIGLRDLEARTGITFPAALHERESPFAMPQAVGDVPPIKLLASAAEYFA